MELILGYICLGLLIACIGVVLPDSSEEKPTNQEGDKAARTALDLASQHTGFLSTIQLGTP